MLSPKRRIWSIVRGRGSCEETENSTFVYGMVAEEDTAIRPDLPGISPTQSPTFHLRFG